MMEYQIYGLIRMRLIPIPITKDSFQIGTDETLVYMTYWDGIFNIEIYLEVEEE